MNKIMWQMLKDFCTVFLPMVTIGILGVYVLVCTLDYVECVGFEKGTGRETKWAFGCYVKVGDDFVPKKYAYGDAYELRHK